ncbi:MAG: flagellar hook-basal body complex protein FliE [Parvularculaceae bacterium]
MAIDAINAAKAYAAAAKTAIEGGAQASEAQGADFGKLVSNAIAETSATLKAGEAASTKVASGEAGLVDVVTAISAAEASLETALAVRNRVIEAYQEIMRMPI